MDRPNLSEKMDGEIFLQYYYLKKELIDFCRRKGLPTKGSKSELTVRISHYLNTKEKKSGIRVITEKTKKRKNITKEDLIERGVVCSELHRAFFKNIIGNSFTFNVPFQKWLKSNEGKTYSDAIEAYYKIKEEIKNGKSVIDRQFEYNKYIRDFFSNNKGKRLSDAIKCWNYKKLLPGHNGYEDSDLDVL